MEQDRTWRALQTAIQMETDGKQYYLKISRESGNELGKRLLAALAAEEDIHRQKFEQIFASIRQKKGWPVTDFKLDGGRALRTLFARALERVVSPVKGPTTELEAVKTAMDMESKTYDFYQNQGGQASYPAEREYYQVLALQEREHHLILLDYYEYLRDPAGWFVTKEHHSLDGG